MGLLTGNLIGGWMADQYGRKPTCCIGSFGSLIFGLLSTFATSYRSFLFLRFLTGLLCKSYVFKWDIFSIFPPKKSNPDLHAMWDGNGFVSELCHRELMFLVGPHKTDRSDTGSERLRPG